MIIFGLLHFWPIARSAYGNSTFWPIATGERANIKFVRRNNYFWPVARGAYEQASNSSMALVLRTNSASCIAVVRLKFAARDGRASASWMRSTG
jgi:hypothetical protein